MWLCGNNIPFDLSDRNAVALIFLIFWASKINEHNSFDLPTWKERNEAMFQQTFNWRIYVADTVGLKFNTHMQNIAYNYFISFR